MTSDVVRDPDSASSGAERMRRHRQRRRLGLQSFTIQVGQSQIEELLRIWGPRFDVSCSDGHRDANAVLSALHQLLATALSGDR